MPTTIDNTGELTVSADSNAVAVNVALTGVGAAVAADAVWDGGTTAKAYADGIRAGAGNDIIDNTTRCGAITSNAAADATSASVAISAAGFSGAVSTSTSIAYASAIDAGEGDDVLVNDSVLDSESDATSTSVAISVTGAGGALASDAFWDGGTKANAFAAGMIGGDGNDTSTNTGSISADAASSTTSVSIAATRAQASPRRWSPLRQCRSRGMTGDGGNDTVVNPAGIHSTTLAEAEGVSVAFAAAGGAIAGAHVDAATHANGTAEGIAGGAGSDTLRNDATGTIDLDSTARARETAVALTLGGIAEADSTSIATARGIGIDGGDGDDVLGNAGSIVGAADAAAAARSITFALFGDGTATADATGDAFAAGITAAPARTSSATPAPST